MTPIEKALFFDETAHWICSFDLTPEAMVIFLCPCRRPELVRCARFPDIKMMSIDRSYVDEANNDKFPWDILSFDSRRLEDGLWEFCLHTDHGEYVFRSAWPEFEKPKKEEIPPSDYQPKPGTSDYHHVICPTCHSVDRSPMIPSVGNAIKIFLNVVLAILLGPTPFKMRRKCDVCHARFTTSSKVKEKVCWKCGYPRKGLPEPRCPECGTWFDTDDRTGC